MTISILCPVFRYNFIKCTFSPHFCTAFCPNCIYRVAPKLVIIRYNSNMYWIVLIFMSKMRLIWPICKLLSFQKFNFVEDHSLWPAYEYIATVYHLPYQMHLINPRLSTNYASFFFLSWNLSNFTILMYC